MWDKKCHLNVLKFDTMQLQSQQKDDAFSRFIVNPSEVRVGHVFNGLCPLSFPLSSQSSTLSFQIIYTQFPDREIGNGGKVTRPTKHPITNKMLL